MNIKNIYEQLTNVDIETQKQIWDERGKGYYGEYLLFCELYKTITGNGKILMNLNIPTDNSKTTEIDLILIHETGLFVFEIKHYKGTIYGKDTDATWTQYFRTVKNNVFKNPIEQNRYHIHALKKLFPETPIYSCIVFTNYDCDIQVTNSNNDIDICHLCDVCGTLEHRFTKSTNNYSMDDIDNIFTKLSTYSQMREPITINGEEADFYSWVQPVISELNQKRTEFENAKNNFLENTENLKKAKTNGIISNVFLAGLCVLISILVCFAVIRQHNYEISKFKQNFLHIDEIDNEYIDSLNSYIEVSNVSLLPLTEDAVNFTARISITNDVYGIALTQNSRYIVMTNSGKVFEYNIFGKNLFYSTISNRIGNGLKEHLDLAEIQFYGISNTDDISYIKITDIELFKSDLSKTLIKNNLEIELYSK